MQTSKQKKTKLVNGIILDNGVILSYDDPFDFQDAWPGIALMLSVMKGEKVSNPAYKGVDL